MPLTTTPNDPSPRRSCVNSSSSRLIRKFMLFCFCLRLRSWGHAVPRTLPAFSAVAGTGTHLFSMQRSFHVRARLVIKTIGFRDVLTCVFLALASLVSRWNLPAGQFDTFFLLESTFYRTWQDDCQYRCMQEVDHSIMAFVSSLCAAQYS